jgi:hypothetical protein
MPSAPPGKLALRRAIPHGFEQVEIILRAKMRPNGVSDHGVASPFTNIQGTRWRYMTRYALSPCEIVTLKISQDMIALMMIVRIFDLLYCLGNDGGRPFATRDTKPNNYQA